MTASREFLLLHLTTVHRRDDTRIAQREVVSLGDCLSGGVGLVVADGCGDTELACNRIALIDVGRLPCGRFGRIVIGSWRMLRSVREAQPDVVHLHDPELIGVGLVCKLTGHRVIYDAHEDLPGQVMYKHWLPPLLRRPVSMACRLLIWLAGRAFDGVVVATPAIARKFPMGKAVVVQNFPQRHVAEWTSGMPYSERPCAIAYVGSLEAVRGAREMVAALEHVTTEDAVLEIAGRISPPALRTELERENSWERVHFHEWLPPAEVGNLLGRARIALVVFHPHPNHIEAQPTKMFEYMAAGVPVVASDFPHWRRIIQDARCGLLVDPMDPKAIAGAMQWMLDHPEEAEAMGERGRIAVQERYNWEAESVKLLDLYRGLLPESMARHTE